MITTFRRRDFGRHLVEGYLKSIDGTKVNIERTQRSVSIQVNKRNRGLGQLTLRIALARQLIDGYSSRKRKEGHASFQAKKREVQDNARLASVGNHMSRMVFNYRRCRKWHRKKQEKRTHYMCAECDIRLYIGTCFSSFKGKYSPLSLIFFMIVNGS
ncbi:piggyBac transposable element-derived protein 4 [Trichonephila clavipes]|nr:piggyBac transposable element-derived protein 4 [Trichonephila clavipes]